MDIDDRTIGLNVQRLRGSMTQSELADAMRRRGWSWSQNTVWKVERGDRPVRLAESVALESILGAPLTEPFSPAERDALAALDELYAIAEQLELNTKRWHAIHYRLVNELDPEVSEDFRQQHLRSVLGGAPAWRYVKIIEDGLGG